VIDLAILVPSRGRPQNVGRLIEACRKTCRASTVLHFGFDEDDPSPNVPAVPSGVIFDPVRIDIQPRMGLTAWTNHLASQYVQTLPEHSAPYLASLGDDMVPETDGWDERLITAIEHMGGGFAYPFDGRRSDIPECCVVSTPIVAALGWMALPTSSHWFIDTAWGDLGRPDRLAYLPDVTVRHLHPNVAGGDPHDQTYEDASPQLGKDLAAYQRWRLMDMPRDRETVRQACSDPAS
jgi:hypothetical protein